MERNFLHNVEVTIYEHEREPAQPPVAFNLLGSKLRQSAIANGTPGDVRQFQLDNASPGEDVAWQEDQGKIPALIPGWRTHAFDNSANDWQQLRSEKETRLLEAAIEDTQAAIAALEQKHDKLSDNETERLIAFQEELDDLQTRGYLETIPGSQLWGDDADGIYRRLSTANVPFRYRSRFTLEQRPFTLWLYRPKPRPKQISQTLKIKIGRLLELVFEGQDRATLYRIHDGREPGEWRAANARREQLLAKRYLSESATDKIEELRENITAIQQAAKDAKQKLDDDQKSEIEGLKKSIKIIQKRAGLTPANKDELKELEKFLFRQIETVQLAETAQSLVGRPFALTFLDSGMGFMQISLDIGRNTYTFEDTYITARRLEKSLWGNPDDRRSAEYSGDEKLEISGNGGALAWRFGYVEVNAIDEILSGDIYLERTIDPEAGAPVTTMRVQPNGTNIIFILNAVPNRPGWFQLGIRFTTDGKKLPVVFRATLQVPADPRPPAAIIWQSKNVPGCAITATPHLDEERKGAMWQITLRALDNIVGGINALGLPDKLRRRTIDIKVDGRAAVTGGVIVDDNWSGAKEITSPGTPQKFLAWGSVRITVRDKLQRVQDALFGEDLELDGQWIGDAIYLVRRNMGATEDELSLLPRGRAGGWQLPSAAIGEKAIMKPSKRAARYEYIMSQIVKRFGMGRYYWIDQNGRDRLDFPANRALAGVNYLPSNVATDPRRQYYASSKGEIERSRSTDKFFTIIEVVGAVDPDIKQKRHWRYELRQAVDPVYQNDPRYVGTHIPMEPVSDDAYNEPHHLEAVGRTLKALFCRAPETWSCTIPYTDDILPGDVVPFSGMPWRVRSAQPPADLNDDELVVELETV
jgi:hypothetical protein